jgi:methionyl-tRNA formyltransferase
MRVVFMGTPEFALPPLRALLASGYSISAVLTQPDRPSGRGLKLAVPPVKALALSEGIPVHQPVKIRSEENRALMESLSPDFLVVAAYGQILPGWLLAVPRIAPVNIHASLLPRYRGAAPIAHAILAGDSITGVTTMWMEERLDSGPILLQREVPIPPEITCGELESTLAETGAELLLPTLDGLREGTLTPRAQNPELASFAPKLTKEMAAVDWRCAASRIHNAIRAFNPWPIAYTDFEGEKLQILRSLPHEQVGGSKEYPPGTFLGCSSRGAIVACGEGTSLELTEVQLPGKRRICGKEFANGARLEPGQPLFSL